MRPLAAFEAFTANRSRRDGLQPYCRACQRAYVREHYLARRASYIAKAKRSRPRDVARLREELAQLKDVPCADCGGTFPPCAMDFDHVRGDKAFNVGEAVRYGLRSLLAEAAKCEIVCANCHRVRTLRRLMCAHSSVG